MAEIRIKRVYEAPAEDDGFRVLVDRLWPRKWFGHKAENFAAFTEKYRTELSTGTAAPTHTKTVAEHLAKGENVTLLYGAKDPQLNQAVVLRDWMNGMMDK